MANPTTSEITSQLTNEQNQPVAIQSQLSAEEQRFLAANQADTANIIEAQNTVLSGDYIAADQAATDAALAAAASEQQKINSRGLTSETAVARAGQVDSSTTQDRQTDDWRVRLCLAPSAKYLYKADIPGILAPLAATDGVIFPYTPAISVAYAAHYDSQDLTHSNYKIHQYRGSSVDTITIGCDFTAQDTAEANYLLAVIHFFRSVTKMFYGQDQNPQPGTPPPLCYLFGLGQFQFDTHPLAIVGFNYTLPTDVDYIRSGSATTSAGVPKGAFVPRTNTSSPSGVRLSGSGLQSGAQMAPPAFYAAQPYTNATYVPTKMSISISAIPIVTRNDISNNFSLKDYATGALLQGSKRKGGGIW
jgi:hypothetical protein